IRADRLVGGVACREQPSETAPTGGSLRLLCHSAAGTVLRKRPCLRPQSLVSGYHLPDPSGSLLLYADAAPAPALSLLPGAVEFPSPCLAADTVTLRRPGRAG